MMQRIVMCLITLFMISGLLAQPAVPYGNNKAAGQYMTVNGVKLYYEVYGKGQPLLLLHGNGGSIADRSAGIPGYAKKYKVIAVDSRCHGKSGCMAGDLNYEMMAADIKALLDALKTDSCLIWGHSDGAILGLIMAMKYPEKVKKLVATGANIQPDTTALFPPLVSMMKMYPMLPDTMMQKHIKLMVDHPHIDFGELNKIKAPVLVMAGDRDAVREEHTVKIYQSIPNAQLSIIPGATHFFASEKPQLFSMLINDFFEKPFEMPSTVAIMEQVAQQLMQQAAPKKQQ